MDIWRQCQRVTQETFSLALSSMSPDQVFEASPPVLLWWLVSPGWLSFLCSFYLKYNETSIILISIITDLWEERNLLLLRHYSADHQVRTWEKLEHRYQLLHAFGDSKSQAGVSIDLLLQPFLFFLLAFITQAVHFLSLFSSKTSLPDVSLLIFSDSLLPIVHYNDYS